MKQKVVIRVCMKNDKSRSKAMKIAVGHSGVESAAIKGEDKNLIEVTGEWIDAANLTTSLRKKVGPAGLLSVGEAEKPKPKPTPEPERPQPVICCQPPDGWCYGTVCLREADPCYSYSPCTLM